MRPARSHVNMFRGPGANQESMLQDEQEFIDIVVAPVDGILKNA